MKSLRVACALCLMLGGGWLSGQSMQLAEDSVAIDLSIWLEAMEAGQQEKDQIHAYQSSLQFPLPPPKPQRITTRDLARALGGFLALAGLGLGAFFLIHFMRGRRKKQITLLTAHQQHLLKKINEELNAGKGHLTQRKAILLIALIQLSKPFAFQWSANSDLKNLEISDQELELIVWTKLKFTIDDIAAEMGLSSSHVYRIRAGLRKKFNLQRQQSLDAFLSSTELEAH